MTFEDENQRAQKLAQRFRAGLGDALPDAAALSRLKEVEALCRPLRELEENPAFKHPNLAAKAQEEAHALKSAVMRAQGLMRPFEGDLFPQNPGAAQLAALSHRAPDILGVIESALQPLGKGYLYPSALGPDTPFPPHLGNSFFLSGGAGSAFRAADQLSFAQQQILGATQGRALGEAARMAQWVGTLTSAFPTVGARAFDEGFHTLVGSMRDTFMDRSAGLDLERLGRLGTALGLTGAFDPKLAVTQLRMAALAGVDDVFGSSSQMHDKAYEALLGHWHTKPSLPPKFWSDRQTRREMYREADVDAGLIEADPSTALELMVESGLVSGFRDETGIVALFPFGDDTLPIRAPEISVKAFKLIYYFESVLRSYVQNKMSALYGPDWFKSAASNLFGKIKQVREIALENGEVSKTLIHYTTLGELSEIIQNRKNWNDIFGDVFVNKEDFRVDMRRIVTLRNPNTHTREIDAVLLTEISCVIYRLIRQMRDDGAWKIAAESDI